MYTARITSALVPLVLLFTSTSGKLDAQTPPADSLWYFYNTSLSCQHDANCIEGRPWSNEIRSVVRFTSDWDNPECTGTFVNTTEENVDEGPHYLLIADHCSNQLNQVDDQAWYYAQYYWERPAADCNDANSPTPYYEYDVTYFTAASLGLEYTSEGDYILVELSSTDLDDYDIYFAGWNRDNSSSPQSGVLIGHPHGDVKKIVIDEGPVTFFSSTWSVAPELGVTQQGQSGSPLFDENHLLVGHTLWGGHSETHCNNPSTIASGGFQLAHIWDSTSPSLGSLLDPIGGGTAMSVLPIANYDLVVTDEVFSDPETDFAAGFFRTAKTITATDVSLLDGGRLHLRARESITITGDFVAEAGGDFLAQIDPVPGGSGGGANARFRDDTVEGALPEAPLLEPNFPNPFRDRTTFRFFIPEPTRVTLTIFDLLGREVMTLMDTHHEAGEVTLRWSPADHAGRPLAAGVYVYRLRVGEHTESGRMTVLH